MKANKTPEELWYEDQVKQKSSKVVTSQLESKMNQQKTNTSKQGIQKGKLDKSGRHSSLNSSMALGSSQECILENRTGTVSQKKKKKKSK